MPVSRRDLLRLGSALLVPASPFVSAGSEPGVHPGLPRWLAACRLASGTYAAAGLDAAGKPLWTTPLPERGHGFALHPARPQAVALARRPGEELLLLDLGTGQVAARTRATPGRHFYGHGAISADGRWLFTTENAIESGEGVIGVRDVNADLKHIGELPAHGIGPHELILGRFRTHDAEDVLIVAVGGIRTHPDTGRTNLNPDSMAPALVYIAPTSGELLERVQPPAELHQLSIRHLAQGADGTVCVGMQYEGPPDRHPPLVGLHRPGEPLRLLRAPAPIHASLRNYCGSIAGDGSGSWFAASAPRGNLVTFWGADGSYGGSAALADGCGVAAADGAGRFLLSGGEGALALHDHGAGATVALGHGDGTRWDNHLTALSVHAVRRGGCDPSDALRGAPPTI